MERLCADRERAAVTAAPADPTAPPAPYDAIIIGAGVAGISLASSLARANRRVLLIAARKSHPKEFRAEKLSLREIEQFDEVGLGPVARALATELKTVVVGHWGHIVDRQTVEEFSYDYADLVDALRAALPPAVDIVVGRTEALEAGPEAQRARLADGRAFEGRILVLATGLGDAARRMVGIARVTASADHGLIYGFEVEAPSWDAATDSVTWRGEHIGDGVAYLTLFRRAGAIRANFFTHWPPGGRDDDDFRRDPAAKLRDVMPGLVRLLGAFEIGGPVHRRPVDLVAVEGHLRDGVVLVGDAFCTTCPTTGTGVHKALTDVSRLAVHLPHWLATPGMPAAKIARFYADETKRACDGEALAASVSRRKRIVAPSRLWRFRRLRSYVYGRVRHEIREKAALLAAFLTAAGG